MNYIWYIKNDVLNVYEDRLIKHRMLWNYYENDKSVDRNESKEVFKYMDYITDSSGFIRLNGLTGDEAHRHAVNRTRLDADWKPSQLENMLIDYIKDNIEHDVIVESIELTIKTLSLSRKALQTYGNMLEEYINKDDNAKDYDVIGIVDKINKASDSIPKSVERLKSLYKQQGEKSKVLRGGHEFKDSMDGDANLEQYLKA